MQSSLIIIIIIISFLWLAPPTVCSATHSQQPSQRLVLSHPVSALWGFTTTSGWKHSFVDIHSGFCSADQSPLSELMEAADDYLFNNICVTRNMF